MKRPAYLVFAILATLVVVLFPASQVTLSEKTSATAKVNCAKGDSINAALASDLKAHSLTIEITGMCRENVVVTRDRVTLRGTDPAQDGIQAVENTELTDAAVWVRTAALARIENLTLTGGFSGLLGTNANLPSIQLTNCRLSGNRNFGIQLENSLANAADTAFEGASSSIPAGIFLSSRLGCVRCTFTSAGSTAVMTVINGFAQIGQQSAFSGGPIRGEGSTINIADSTMASSSPGVPAINAISSSVILTRTEILGRMFFGQGTNTMLNGVTQTGIGMQPNEASFGSTVIIASAGQPTGGPPLIDTYLAHFTLSNFANLVLNQASTIDGDLICRTGSNAHCANPAGSVTGATNCGLCPKP
jgi:hypothetical protein